MTRTAVEPVRLRPPVPAPVWLASRSPRRHRMLADAGVPVTVRPSVDDGALASAGKEPAAWVMALAYLKARWVVETLAAEPGPPRGTVLGADTVCVSGSTILGQPASADEARGMLHRLRDAAHTTMTGVCLIRRSDGARHLFADRATVRIGAVPDETIEAYLATDEWRGKAGAYNLADRVRAGWPIECDGDPATVMGLPMRRLATWLAGARPA